ncbi:MAG: rane assembly protein AsmA [Rubritepida sp.]|nr:rane assembly protein AsmA [Rubritepida sp.]
MRIPKTLRWLGGAALVLVVLVLLFRWDWLIPMVEARASAALGRPVSIAHLDVKLRRVSEITLTDLRVANPDGFPAEPPLAQVARTVVHIDTWALLRHGSVIVPSVAFEQPAVQALGNPDGTNNFTFPALAGPKPEGESAPGPQIGRIAIAEGRAHVNLQRLAADFNLQIATTETEGQDPSITVRAEGTYAAQPITGEVTGGAILGLRDTERPWPIRGTVANGPTRVTLEGTVQDPLTSRGADLRLTWEGPNMALLLPLTGIAIPPTPAYRIAGRLDFSAERIRFHEIQGLVGRTDLNGDIVVVPEAARPASEIPLAPATQAPGRQAAAAPARPRRATPDSAANLADRMPESAGRRPDVTINLNSRRVDLRDLGGFIGAAPQQGVSNAPTGRTIPDTPTSIPRIRAADIHLVYHGQRIEGRSMPLDNLRVAMDIVDGVIQLHPVSFGVGTGQIAATGTLTPQEDGALRAEANVEFQRVDISRLLGATGVAQGNGTLGGRARLTSTGRSTAELLARGDGAVTLSMAGGNLSALLVDLAGLRIGNAILSALGLPNRTRIECFIADLGMQRGVLNARTVLLDTSDVLITVTGTVDLARERLATRITTESKHMSVGVIPSAILVDGSFTDPRILPEVLEFGMRGGLAAALGIVTLPLALLPTIQFGIGDDPRCRGMVGRSQRSR